MRQFLVITAVAIAIAGCGTMTAQSLYSDMFTFYSPSELKAETRGADISGRQVTLNALVDCREGLSYWFVGNPVGGTGWKTKSIPCKEKGKMPVSYTLDATPGVYQYAAVVGRSESSYAVGSMASFTVADVPTAVESKPPIAPQMQMYAPAAVPLTEQTALVPDSSVGYAKPQPFGVPGLTLGSCNSDTRTARGFLPWKKFGGDPYQGSPEQAIAEFEWPEELKKMALAEIRGGNPARSVLKRGDTLNAMAFGRLLPGNKAKVRKNVIVCFPEYKTDVYSVTYQGQEIKIYKPLCGNWSWRAVPAGAGPSSGLDEDEVPPEATRATLAHVTPKTAPEEKRGGFDWSTAKVVGRIDLTPAPQAPAMMMQPYPIAPAYYPPASYSCYPFCTFSGRRGRDWAIDRGGVKLPGSTGSTTLPAS